MDSWDSGPESRLYPVTHRGRTAAGRAEQHTERDRYLDLAMIALRRAREKGFPDGERLRHDRDLDALRQRGDFRQLVAGLAN